MKTRRPTFILSFARSVTAVTLIVAAIAMTFIAVSSGSGSADGISSLPGNTAMENRRHAPDIPITGRDHGHGPKLVWLKVMAFTDAPVVGADVRVSVHGSQGRPLAEVKAATNNQGVVPVLVRAEPSLLRVSISGSTSLLGSGT